MKEEFLNLLKTVNRDGIDKLIEFIDKTDFYTAPASTKYHNSFEWGLLEHSVNVYKALKELTKDQWSDETLIIVGLLHDICKINYFTTDDLMPLGHGEKSVMIISEFIKLTKEEIYAIRWHMGGFEPKENYSYVTKTFEKYPLAVYTHMADLMATYIYETR